MVESKRSEREPSSCVQGASSFPPESKPTENQPNAATNLYITRHSSSEANQPSTTTCNSSAHGVYKGSEPGSEHPVHATRGVRNGKLPQDVNGEEWPEYKYTSANYGSSFFPSWIGSIFDSDRVRRTAPAQVKGEALSKAPLRSSFSPGDWIRPLGNFEMLMAIGGFYGSLNTIQALRLSSSQPIRPEVVRSAITAVARKTEVLQLAVARRWLWLWFRRTSFVSVPFAVEQGDVMEVYYRLMEATYDFRRGPLWRARLVPVAGTSPGRYEAVLMFTVHHAITDAFTNMIICRETLQVLNATMTGTVYEPPTRRFIPSSPDQLVTKKDIIHAIKFAAYKICSPTLLSYSKEVYFNGVIPQPETTVSVTKVLHEEFTPEATKKLLQQCKSAGVTVHSCIMTLAKLAILQVAHQRSEGKVDEATLKVFNCVNLRRYLPCEQREATGCYISIEEQVVTVHTRDSSTKENFWSLVKRVHDSLQHSLNVARNPVRNLPAFMPCAVLIPLNYSLTLQAKKNLCDNHIISTNMGDLKNLLPAKYGEGPVEVTHLLRCVCDPFTGHPYTLVFHTFLQRFSICLEYYTTKTTDDVAQQFFTCLTTYISDVLSCGAVGVGSDLSANTHKDKFYPASTTDITNVV